MRKITKTRILSMVLAGAMAVGICTPFGKISNVYAEQTNAIPNPGFEDGQLPWYVTADEDGLDTGILTEEGTGNKLAYLNIKEKLAMDYNSKVIGVSQRIENVPEGKYTVGCRFKVDCGENCTTNPQINFTATGQYSHPGVFGFEDGKWVNAVVTGVDVVSDGKLEVEFDVWVPKDCCDATIYVDDFYAYILSDDVASVMVKIRDLPDRLKIKSSDAEKIAEAKEAYDALETEDKANVFNYSRLEEALDRVEVVSVIEMINGLSDEITLDDDEDVSNAREAYDALSEAQQGEIDGTTYSKLTDAEAAIATLMAPIEAILTDIANLSDTITLADDQTVSAIRAAYNALGDVEKTYIDNDSLTKLTNAETTISDLKTAAANVATSINNLSSTITLDDEDTVAAIREAYDALSEEQQALISNELKTKLEAAEAIITSLNEVKAVATKISDLNDPITLTDEDAVEDARSAFNALDSDQKALVSKELKAKLEAAEKTIKDIKAANAVIKMISDLSNPITIDDEEDVASAMTAYNNLSNDQKLLVGDDNAVTLSNANTIVGLLRANLTSVENAIKNLDVETFSSIEKVETVKASYDALPEPSQKKMNADRKAQLDSAIEVAKVLKTIDSLPDQTDITVEDMDQIKAAEDAFDSLTKAQKDNLMPDVEAKLENAENAVIDLVSQAIAKVSSPVTIESEKDITEARKLYDALSDKLKNNPTAQTVVKLLEGKEAELENLKKSQSVPTVTPAPAAAPTAAVTPTPAAATKEPVVGDIVSDGTSEYEVTSVNSIDGVVTEGTAVYKKNLDSKLTTIEIPDVVTVDDVSYNVTGVANDALKGNKKIKKLIIGENVETIGKRAFSGCIKLASVNMKSPVLKTIDDNAFFNCKSLKSYTVSTGVTTIGARAFMNCKKLTKITFKGKNVKKINANAFKNVPKTCKAKAPKKAVKSYKKLMKKAAYKGSVSK